MFAAAAATLNADTAAAAFMYYINGFYPALSLKRKIEAGKKIGKKKKKKRTRE